MTPILTLCWKEHREQRNVWLAIALLAVMLIAVPGAAFAADTGSLWGRDGLGTGLIAISAVLAGAYGVVSGAMLLAGEREGRTESFLMGLPARRSAVWFAKVAAGGALTLAQALLIGLCCLFYPAPQALGSHAAWLAIIVLVALDAFAWGVCASAWCLSALAAAGLAVLLRITVGGAGSLVALVALVLVSPAAGAHLTQPEIALPVYALVDAGALAASLLVYAQVDRRRQPPRVRPLLPARTPRGWLGLFWLTWRQGRWQVAALGVVAIPLGLAVTWWGPWVWPPATLAIGLACGTAVFAGEQASHRGRFLGDQRFPPWRIWLAKTVFWGLAAAATCMMTFVMFSATWVSKTDMHGMMPESFSALLVRLQDNGAINRFINPMLYLTLWPVYGFTTGLLSSQLVGKRIVALFLATAVSILILAAWLPTLICNGWSAWQLFAIPLLLALASAIWFRAWLGDRLRGKRLALELMLGTLLIVCWLGANIANRAYGLPDVGEPFDVDAYLAELDEAARSPATGRVPAAVAAMKERMDWATRKVGQLKAPLFPDPTKPASQWEHEHPNDEYAIHHFEQEYQENLAQALERGWPKEQTQLDDWLGLIFAGSWAKDLSEAVRLPPGLLVDPRRAKLAAIIEHIDDCRTVASLLVGRAAQLQARGKNREALEQLATNLFLAGQVRNHASAIQWLFGISIEYEALEGLANWRFRLRNRKDLLALELKTLQEATPKAGSLADVLKHTYLVYRNNLPDLFLGNIGIKHPTVTELTLAKQAPWEMERDRHVLDLYFAYQTKLVATPAGDLFSVVERDMDNQDSASVIAGTLFGLMASPLGDLPLLSLAPVALDGLEMKIYQLGIRQHQQIPSELRQYPFAWVNSIAFEREYFGMRMATERLMESKTRMDYNAAAAEISTALALYEATEGLPAPGVHALVPVYLPAIPINPFTGKTFTKLPPPLQWRYWYESGGTPVSF